MRDIALVLVFGAALPFALRYTWVGVLLWTWISVMNPHRLCFGFAYNLPFAQAAALATLASLPFNAKDLRRPSDPALVILMLFVAWTAVTTVNAIYPGDSLEMLVKVAKIQLMTLIAAMAIRSRMQIEAFIWVNALSLGFYGAKGGVFTFLTGGGERVWGPGGSFIEGNNEIGLAIIIAIPLLNYLRLVATRAWVRWGLMATMFLSAIAALGTQSRGALLAIGAMALVLWSRSQRKIVSAIVIGATAIGLVAFLPNTWDQRMQTIGTYQSDSSAMGRINAWWNAYHLANHRFLGGGFQIYTPEVFAQYAPDPEDVHAAHSIYFQVLGEHGWVGLILFLGIGVLAFLYAARIRREASKRADTQWLYHLAGMIQVSMAGYAVGGAFLSLAYFDLPYNLLVALISAKYWLIDKRWETDRLGAFGAGAPVGRLPRHLRDEAKVSRA